MKKFLTVLVIIILVLMPVNSLNACVNPASAINIKMLWPGWLIKYTYQLSQYSALIQVYQCKTVQFDTNLKSSQPIITINGIPSSGNLIYQSAPEQQAESVVYAPQVPVCNEEEPITEPEAPSADTNSGYSAMQIEMLGYINEERAEANLSPLVLDEELCQGASIKSQDMVENNYFSHTSPTYGSPFDMMKSLGITYKKAGENIAYNCSVIGAHDAFMNSYGHKTNILNPGFNKVGLGFFQDGSRLYVTQWFTD